MLVSVEENCLFWGYRIIILKILQTNLLNEFHVSHLGIVKIKMLARSYIWWPSIDHDIENVVKACKIYLEEQKKPPHTMLTPWPWPEKTWSRLHYDFLGPFFNNMYLVIIDAHLKWSEIINFKQNTKSYRLIEEFKHLFARHGIPNYIVTDNDRQFTNIEIREFLQRNGVKQSFSPPYHPVSNGAAENCVATFKNKSQKL